MTTSTGAKPLNPLWLALGLVCVVFWIAALTPSAPSPKQTGPALTPNGNPKMRPIERACHIHDHELREKQSVSEVREYLRRGLLYCEALWLIDAEGRHVKTLASPREIP